MKACLWANLDMNSLISANRDTSGDMRHRLDLLLVLVKKEFTVRYKRTILGYIWSVLQPLAMAMIYLFVFKLIFKIKIPDYTLVILSGQFPWQWLANTFNASNNFFLGNSSLLKRVKFPRFLLVLSGCCNDMIHFVASLPVIVIFIFIYGRHPHLNWLWLLPLLLLVHICLTIGLALIAATLNMFFRDMERLTNIFTTMWYFGTPVVWTAAMVPAKYKFILYLNPASGLLLGWRSMFMGTPVNWLLLGVSGLWALGFLIIGALVYRAFEWRFAEVV